MQYSLTPLSTLIVDRHGYHSDVVATAVQRGSHVVKKSHAVHSDTLSVKAGAPVRHDGVSSIRSMSADGGKTIVCCRSSSQPILIFLPL